MTATPGSPSTSLPETLTSEDRFLRKHHCHVAFQQFRTIQGRPIGMMPEDLCPAEVV